MLPLIVLQTAAIALGVGLWIAALTVRYRDFYHLIGFMTQLWMYATPVIYPVSAIPGKWRFLMNFNPMAGIVEYYRHAFFQIGTEDVHFLPTSALTAVVLLVSGIFIFNKVERTFVDTL